MSWHIPGRPWTRLPLSDDERTALIRLRDTSPKAYLRERAAALLKIGRGRAPAAVARTGLFKPRRPNTVYDWLQRYRQEGIGGLTIRSGRGRKPAFSPCAPRR